jgi:hypothetical protein
MSSVLKNLPTGPDDADCSDETGIIISESPIASSAPTVQVYRVRRKIGEAAVREVDARARPDDYRNFLVACSVEQLIRYSIEAKKRSDWAAVEVFQRAIVSRQRHDLRNWLDLAKALIQQGKMAHGIGILEQVILPLASRRGGTLLSREASSLLDKVKPSLPSGPETMPELNMKTVGDFLDSLELAIWFFQGEVHTKKGARVLNKIPEWHRIPGASVGDFRRNTLLCARAILTALREEPGHRGAFPEFLGVWDRLTAQVRGKLVNVHAINDVQLQLPLHLRGLELIKQNSPHNHSPSDPG